MEKSRYLDILQVYRGIAALVVVIHHSIPSILFFNKIDFPLLLNISAFGKLGVDFFFVLSGFIIAYTNLGRVIKIKDYLVKRIARIYVPYLPIGISIMILYLVLPQLSASDCELSILNSLTLFPLGNPALSVAWSLSYEIFFYLIFVICIFNRKWFHILIWSILIFVSLGTDNEFNSFLFKFYILEFFIGYVLAYSIVFKKRYIYILMMVSVGLTNYFILPSPLFNISMALFFSFLIYASIDFYNLRLGKKNIFMIIGACSCSIYLVHNPIQSFLVRKLTFISNSNFLILLDLLIILTCSIIVGYIYYRIFEIRLTKKILDKLR